MSSIPMIEKSEVSPLPNFMANRAEDEAMGSFPEEGTQTEQPGMIATTHSNEMPETLRVEFLTSMFKAKIFTQRSQSTPLNSLDIKFSERTIAVKEQGPLTIMSPSSIPSFHVLVDFRSLSDSNKETEQYLEQILSSVTVESPFAQVSSIADVPEKTLGFKHGGAREAEATTTKEVSASTARRWEIRTISIANYKSRLRREGSIVSQVATYAFLVGGSTSGRTPYAIYWFVSETLNQLGKKWLGNPLTTLAGLIPAPAMAEVKVMTSQETTDHMIFHLINVSILRFDWVVYLISFKLNLFPCLAGLHAWHGLLL
jgi:hypothetical protein